MNDVTELIVGIDIGSSGLRGALARKNSGGKIELLTLKHLYGKTGIRRGAVHNIEEVSGHVQTLIDQLKEAITGDCKIAKVYIGINGYTIRTIDATASTRMSGDETLKESLLDELSDDAQCRVPEGLQIVDVFPQEFVLDGKIDVNPVGTMPELVEAHYKIAVCQPFLFKNLDACFESLDDLTYEPVLGPLATAEAVLKPEEMGKGVVVVNFGAQTTSVCVYKGNIVRYVSTLPFGGDNITKDLECLNIEEDEAEKYKIESGSAVHLEDMTEEEEALNDLDKVSTFDKEANEIIIARAEEIVENIYAQIRYAGIEPQKLTEGIIMTGGASDLSGLSELLSKKTAMPVRKASPGQQLVNLTGIDINQEDALCLGLLMLGRADCCVEWKKAPELEKLLQEPVIEGFEPEIKKEPVKTKNPPKQKDKKKNPIGGFWNKLFDDEDI